MIQFEQIKAAVTPRAATELYGITADRNDMVCCPFHDDRHPSLKLNHDYFYCFGCWATGDVIDFTSKLFGILYKDATERLSADFRLTERRPFALAKLKEYQIQTDNEKLCFRVLNEYLHILQGWKRDYTPETPDDEPDDRFVEACHMLDGIEYCVWRMKEQYASNPDVNTNRSKNNFHLITPVHKYRAESEKQIAEMGCRTRSDIVRMVEALVTASPEFFKGKKRSEVKAYFTEALDFIQKHQSKETIISAVVHMDEKTPICTFVLSR